MAQYPTPIIGGPRINRYTKHRLDWKEITEFSRFEDGGVDTLETAAAPPLRWTLVYTGLTEAQMKTILDHYDAHRLSVKFTFQEPRDAPWTGAVGTTYTNLVQYEEAPAQPEHRIYYGRSLTVKLIKYPA